MSSTLNECDRCVHGGHVVVVDCFGYGFCAVVCGDGDSACVGHTLSNAVLMLKQDWLVLAWLHFLVSY